MGENFYGFHYRSSLSVGRDCIFVVVDTLIKFSHFFSIPMDYKAIQVAELFFREVFWLQGLPRQIVSDRDRRFINVFW
jgi:hypothetical protein